MSDTENLVDNFEIAEKKSDQEPTEELPTDIYVRKIDLRYNKITESQILGPFIESMYINESILNIDFSFNSGHTDTVK